MKKTLLLSSFAIFGLMANAQLVTDVTQEDLLEAGFSADGKVALGGGVIYGNGEAGTIATAYADNWGISAPAGNYKTVMVGDKEVTLQSGAVGDTNPTFVNYASGVMSAGAVFEIAPAKSGWLTVFTKVNPNKQYVVFEGDAVGLAYSFGYSNGETTIEYTLPYTEDYAIDFYADDAADYFVAAGGEGPEEVKPKFPWEVAGMAEKFESQDTGFLTFNVVEGNKYYFSALGSKAPCGTFVLTEGAEAPSITFLATETLPAVSFGPGFETGAGVGSIEAAPLNENAPVYNVMGQNVDASYKGIVIKNGKKYIQK